MSALLDRFHAAWARSPITRLRLVVASMLVLIATLNISLLFNNNATLRTLSGLSGIVLALTMFAAPIWGTLARVIHARHAKLRIEHAAVFTQARTDEGRWHLFTLDPPMQRWIAENCMGRVGVMPRRINHIERDDARTLWFSHPQDAMAFKMRWYGLSRDATAAALTESAR